MPLTSEERSAINRQNAAHSTGPKSSEGKAASRRNALKHGLRADALALPNEDPAIVAARNDSWNDYYKPQSPAAQHLVNQCVQATLLADRCHQFHHAALSKQIREAEMHDHHLDAEDVRMITQGFAQNPGRTVSRLTQTGPGLRYMIARWEHLGQVLDSVGHWTPAESDEAIRLHGYSPHPDTLANYPDGWLIRLYSLIITPGVPRYSITEMFEAFCFPAEYRGDFSAERLPEAAASLTSLHGLIAERLAPLRDLEADYRAVYEDPSRDEVESRSMILLDPAEARLFLRYHAEARTAFHRSYRELVKTLEADAASPVEDVSPNEANAEASPPLPQDELSPNEPNSSAKHQGKPSFRAVRRPPEWHRGSAGLASNGEEAQERRVESDLQSHRLAG